MRLPRALLGLLPFTLPLALFGACADQHVALGVIMRAPNGVMDGASTVELRVINAANASCDPVLGQVTGTTDGEDLLTFSMQQQGCAGGALWCKEISLDQDGEERVFYVLASAGGAAIAQGCTTAAVDRDPLELEIKMARFLPVRCCGNGVLEPTEQCDSSAPATTDCAGNPVTGKCGGVIPDDVCECDCLAREILVSTPNSMPNMNNDAATKFELAMAFAGGTGNLGAGLRAVFTDTSNSASTTPDINVRYFDGELRPFDNPILNKQLRLPQCNSVTKQGGDARTQKQAAIAQLSSKIAGVVYASDQDTTGKFNIYISRQTDAGCAEAKSTQVNTSLMASAHSPDIAAGPSNQALIVWNDSGNLTGRIWRDDNTFPAGADIALGPMALNAHPHVAGSTNEGWVVGYQSADNNIYYNTVSTNGQVGSRVRVNIVTKDVQSDVDVAMLSDGRFALVWNNNGAIVFQRYDAQGTLVAGDQEHALNSNSGNGSAPTIAASDLSGGFFAVAWENPDNGGVWGRFAGASSGFLFNSVTGQDGEYLASHPAIVTARSAPAIAIGGDGYVAIGWSDNSNEHPGLYVRRFPLPAAQ